MVVGVESLKRRARLSLTLPLVLTVLAVAGLVFTVAGCGQMEKTTEPGTGNVPAGPSAPPVANAPSGTAPTPGSAPVPAAPVTPGLPSGVLLKMPDPYVVVAVPGMTTHIAADGLRVDPEDREVLDVWLLNPFTEPRRQAVRVRDDQGRLLPSVDLAPFAQELPARRVPVSGAGWLKRVGPVPHGGLTDYRLYHWATDDVLALESAASDGSTAVAGLIDLRGGPNRVVRAGSFYSLAVSADGSRLAYADRGYLVIRELDTGAERRWPMTKDPDTGAVFFDLLTWSPDGRHLLGSFYYQTDEGQLADSLWSLDVSTGKLQGLRRIARHAYSLLAWSKDGGRAVLREWLEAHTECQAHQVLEVTLATGDVEEITAQREFRTEYRVTWLPGGQAKAEPIYHGPGGTDAVAYDPAQRLYAYQLEGPEPFIGTELRFLNPEHVEQLTLDMAPGMKQAGVPLGQIEGLVMTLIWSADDRYALLEGYADRTVLQRQPSGVIRGVFDTITRSVRFLPFEKDKTDPPWAFFLPVDDRWSGDRVLFISNDQSRLAVLDAANLKVTTLLEGQKLLHARWVGPDVLYVTAGEVGLVGMDGARRALVTAPSGEVFTPNILLSPGGRRLAVPRLSCGEGGLTWVTLEVLDLTALPK